MVNVIIEFSIKKTVSNALPKFVIPGGKFLPSKINQGYNLSFFIENVRNKISR